MKRIISLLLSFVMLFTFSVFTSAFEGENYVLFSTTDVEFPENQHVSGDSNGDGKVNVLDVVTTLKYISGTKKGSRRDTIDTNGDGTVNLVDAMLIIKHVLGEDVGLGKVVG